MFRLRPLSPCRRRSWSAAAVVAFIGLATIWNVAIAQSPSDRSTGEANGAAVAGIEHFLPTDLFLVLGKSVLSATGADMGRIVDVLFDHTGKPCAAIIDFGGFLGVGTRKIAVDWGALRFDLGEKKNVIALDLGREQLKAAPEYKESDKPIAVVTLPRLGPDEGSPSSSR